MSSSSSFIPTMHDDKNPRVDFFSYCYRCNKRFISRFSMDNHNRIVHGHLREQCNLCGTLFKTQSELEKHKEDDHKHDDKNPRVDFYCYCNPCDKRFNSKASLDKHNRRVHGFLKEQCNFCGTLFKTQSELENHKEDNHTEEKGIKLMEVYHIRYLSYDTLTPEKQCGTISLVSDTGVQYLYNVQNVEMKKRSIICGDEIIPTVKGPTCSFRNLRIEFDLFDGAYRGFIPLESDSHKVSDNLISVHDKKIISGDRTGKISVLLGFYGTAIIARLEISLLNNSAASRVYGAIFTTNSKVDLPQCTSVLFAKKRRNKIIVRDDGLIPLSKSRVAVPLLSKLYVDISLHVNDEHHTATVCFDAKKAEPEVHSTSHVVVKVNWDVDKESTFDEISSLDGLPLERLSTDFASVDMEL